MGVHDPTPLSPRRRALAAALSLLLWETPVATLAGPLPAQPVPSATPSPDAVPSHQPSPDDLITQTEDYKRLKAEVRFPEGDRSGRWEVSIAGILVNDLQLARSVGDPPLIARLENQQFVARLWQGITAGVTIPAGAYLLVLANQRLNNARSVNGGPDGLTFLFGFLGSLAAVYGFINLVPLFNDLAGLDSSAHLTVAEVTDLVRRYNERLKERLRNRQDLTPALPAGPPLVGWSWTF